MTLIDYKLKLIHITKTMDCANMTIVECIRYAILSNKVDIADAMAKAFNSIRIGAKSPTPVRAAAPIPGICPIYILSTIL